MIQVGFGSTVITPPLPLVLAGFGARKGAVDDVHDDLQARAMVVRSGDATVCLLVLDLLMLGEDFARPLRTAVGEALGIPASHVLTSCTHTHAGPAATASLRRVGWQVPVGYRELLVDGCVRAAREAGASAHSAVLSYARAPLPAGLSLNRRGLPYAPTYAVLDVRTPDGARLGSVANVGIHPVALGVTCRAVSGDWVTTYREEAEKRTGAPAILLPGALGDVNPIRDPHTDPDAGGNWETARLLGSEVADCAGTLLEHAEQLEAPTLAMHRRVIRVRAGLTLASVVGTVAGRRREVELVEWGIGDLRLVSLPGEAFHALGASVESARGERTLLAGLSPIWQGYLPVPFGQGYEEKMSYGRKFVARVHSELLRVPGGRD